MITTVKLFCLGLMTGIVLGLQAAPSPSRTAEADCKYEISIRFDPNQNKLSGEVKVIHPSDSVFVLAKTLNVISVKAGGKNVPFTTSANSSLSNEYSVSSKPETLVINYSGQIRQEDFPKTISNLNMLSPDLIELSDHIDWYPKMKIYSQPVFHLSVNLPENFDVVTNCNFISETKTGERKISVWESDENVYSLTLLAAPEFKKSVLSENGSTIEIYYKDLPATYIDSMKADLMKTWDFYKNLYGVNGANDELRIVYSPRTAGGYARAPLIVVSENYALEQFASANGFARDFRLNAHEMAHYWSKAATSTSEDWINEGLAEFSALLASERFIGKNFSQLLVDEYKGMVYTTQTDVSVLETKSDSWERDINRYYKPTLLLNDLKEKYGDNQLDEFFSLLYKKFEEAKAANTGLFMEALKETYGTVEADSFLKALSEKNWVKETKRTAVADLDTAIIGTWTGKLSQFGTTTLFVLNIKIAGSEVVATLDSPDQNAFDIPVSEFGFIDDTIFFRVGVASASYSGKLNRVDQTITGIWKQRDAGYSLDISRQNKK